MRIGRVITALVVKNSHLDMVATTVAIRDQTEQTTITPIKFELGALNQPIRPRMRDFITVAHRIPPVSIREVRQRKVDFPMEQHPLQELSPPLLIDQSNLAAATQI
jgi:hypothetical protein